MKKAIFAVSFLTILSLFTTVFAQGASEYPVIDKDNSHNVGVLSGINIDDNGKVTVQGARIKQIAGSTLYARVTWGDVFLRLIIRTNSKTVMTKRYGAAITVKDIQLGDYVDVEGELPVSADSLNVTAFKLKDWSIQNDQNSFTGTVKSVNISDNSVNVETSNQGIIKAVISTSTPIIKGNLKLKVADIRVGDRATTLKGLFDYPTKTLTVSNIKIYEDMGRFWPKNYEGILKSIDITNRRMIVSIGDKDYNINYIEKAEITNNKKEPLSISRFLVGDKVKFYGALLESDQTTINKVEIIRNLSL